MSTPSTVIISLDCEGLWGLADQLGSSTRAINAESLTWAYQSLLALLEKHSLAATFAVVSLFASDQDFLRNSLESLAASDAHREWLDPIQASIATSGVGGWTLPISLDRIVANQPHEIASHGFTHLPLKMSSNPPYALELELAGVAAWAQRYGVSSTSFVYPRNQVVEPEALRALPNDACLGYRTSNVSASPIRRVLSEFNLWAESQPDADVSSPPVAIPGGTLMNWRHGVRRSVPLRVTQRRWHSILTHAAAAPNRVAHLWLHPHNLITGHRQLELLDRLLKETAEFISGGDLCCQTQADYARQRLADH